MPTPTPPVDEFLRRRTRLALHVAARDLRRHMEAPTFADARDPGMLLEAARVASVLDKRLKTVAVICARIVHGQEWADIAASLAMPEEVVYAVYGEAVTRWVAGDATPWAPVLACGTAHVRVSGAFPIDITAANIEELSAELAARVGA